MHIMYPNIVSLLVIIVLLICLLLDKKQLSLVYV